MLVAASTGLRQSELFGLKWGDTDFAQNTMSVTRSMVCGVVGRCKTESSQKPVPVHPTVLQTLGECKQVCRYNKPRRLGFCKQTSPWPEADLGSGDLAQIYSSRRVAGRNSEAIRKAHIPSHVLDFSAECRDRIQSDARAAATFLFAFNVGCLHAGDLTSEACCTSSRTRSRICVGSELRCSRVSTVWPSHDRSAPENTSA